MDIDAFAIRTIIRADAAQTDIGAIVVILAGDADEACLQVEVELVDMGRADDVIAVCRIDTITI